MLRDSTSFDAPPDERSFLLIRHKDEETEDTYSSLMAAGHRRGIRSIISTMIFVLVWLYMFFCGQQEEAETSISSSSVQTTPFLILNQLIPIGSSTSSSSSSSSSPPPSVLPDDGTVVCNGFSGLAMDDAASSPQSSSSSCPMHWYCAPDSWQASPEDGGAREGHGGHWSISSASPVHQDRPSSSSLSSSSSFSLLTIQAPAMKDYWRITYYNPTILKDDAPFAYAELDTMDTQHERIGEATPLFYTMTTSFTLDAVQQFDQAGLMVRLSSTDWLKAGIEVVDHRPRLSVVVTNFYSDWSTQEYPYYSTSTNNTGNSMASNTTTVSCRIRVHMRGDSYVVEAWHADSKQWEMIRIAYMNTNRIIYKLDDHRPTGKMLAGVFAACPSDQQGAKAVFDEFTIVTGSQFVHNANGN